MAAEIEQSYYDYERSLRLGEYFTENPPPPDDTPAKFRIPNPTWMPPSDGGYPSDSLVSYLTELKSELEMPLQFRPPPLCYSVALALARPAVHVPPGHRRSRHFWPIFNVSVIDPLKSNRHRQKTMIRQKGLKCGFVNRWAEGQRGYPGAGEPRWCCCRRRFGPCGSGRGRFSTGSRRNQPFPRNEESFDAAAKLVHAKQELFNCRIH